MFAISEGNPAGLCRFPSPHQIFIPPTTKQQFSSYNPIKTAFLAVAIALAPVLF